MSERVTAPRATLEAYREWAKLVDRLEAGAASSEDRSRADALAAHNPLCAREHALRAELAGAGADLGPQPTELSRTELQLVAASLQALRQQSTVVALRPGTAPPASATRGRNTRSMLLAAAALGGAALYGMAWGLGPEREQGAATDPMARSELGAPTRENPPAHEQPTDRAAPLARVLSFSGSLNVDGAPQRAAGAELAPGARIRVDTGTACIQLSQRVLSCLAADTEATLPRSLSPERTLEVERGTVVARLAAQPTNGSFTLAAGLTRARALGTVFGLTKEADGSVSVAVLEGRVQVSAVARTTAPAGAAVERYELTHGQRFSSATGQVVALSAELAELHGALLPGRALDAELAGERAEARSVVYVESEPPGAIVLYDGQRLGTTPLSAWVPVSRSSEAPPSHAQPSNAQPSVEHVLRLELAGHRREERRLELVAGDQHRLYFALDPEPTGKTPRAAPSEPAGAAPAGGPRELLTAARQAQREGRWAEAAATYRRLRQSHPGSAEAKTVTVALGQLSLDRLGQPRAALQSFQAYLDAGGGALSEEARHGKIRALRALGERSQELRAIQEYLELYRGSANTPGLHQRARDLGGS